MSIPTYIMVLYEKDRDKVPKKIGYKTISKEEFKCLTIDYFVSIETAGKMWTIMERRWFWHETALCNTAYVILDAIPDKK